MLERMRNQGGMTLLDWFAGQALTGILADSESQGEPEDFSAAAYNIAESMLAEKARREAVVQESSTTDHSGEAGKMVELEKRNRELVEALSVMEMWVPTHCENQAVTAARAVLARAKEIKP